MIGSYHTYSMYIEGIYTFSLVPYTYLIYQKVLSLKLSGEPLLTDCKDSSNSRAPELELDINWQPGFEERRKQWEINLKTKESGN